MDYITITDEDLAVSVLKQFTPAEPIFADTEGGGLYVDLRLIQLYQPATTDIVFTFDLDYVSLDTIKEAIKPMHTVWAGANYDFGALNMTTSKFDDIQLLIRTAYPNLPAFDLATITKHLIVEDLYEGLDKKALQKARFKPGTVLTEEQLRYAATDVYALSILWKLPKVQELRTELFYEVDMLSLKYAVQFQQNGALVNVDGVKKELAKMPIILEKEEKILGGVNSKSSPQVRKAFGELLGVAPTKTDKNFLIDIITGHSGTKLGDFAKAVFDNRRSRLRVTNLEKLLVPKVYTKFNPYGTVTGRFSSTGGDLPNGINMQNITRNLKYLLAHDTEDTVVIHADYSTAELRSACSLMGDKQMREYLLEGKDLHKVSAMLADSTIKSVDDVTKEQRQKGKAVSFGLIFGMSAPRFKEYAYTDYGVIFTDDEAKAVIKAYQKEFPDVVRYHKYWWNNYKNEYVKSPMGRKNKARLGTDAINFATQSSIGETAKLAIHYLIKDKGDEALKYLFKQEHDAIELRVPKEVANEWAYALVTAMLKGWKEILKLPDFKFKDIPMGVEFEVGEKSDGVEVFGQEQLDKWYKDIK